MILARRRIRRALVMRTESASSVLDVTSGVSTVSRRVSNIGSPVVRAVYTYNADLREVPARKGRVELLCLGVGQFHTDLRNASGRAATARKPPAAGAFARAASALTLRPSASSEYARDVSFDDDHNLFSAPPQDVDAFIV